LAFSSASISNVYVPVDCPATQYMASAPTSATTDPRNRYSVSFMAAYSRVCTQPQITINKYIGKTAIS
jgi:hypothetical protein